MKNTVRCLLLFLILMTLFISSSDASAAWYAGTSSRYIEGVAAYISTPAGLYIIEMPGQWSGESNWISALHYDTPSIRDWLQTGWRYYHGWEYPREYWEYCISCDDDDNSILENGDGQVFGQNRYYRIQRDGPNYWCTYIDGRLHFCINDLFDSEGYQECQVSSEVKGSIQNTLFTTFDLVQYKKTYGNWMDFPPSTPLISDLPYSVHILAPNTRFRTYRGSVSYLPVILR